MITLKILENYLNVYLLVVKIGLYSLKGFRKNLFCRTSLKIALYNLTSGIQRFLRIFYHRKHFENFKAFYTKIIKNLII